MTARFLAEFEMYVMLAVARLGDDAYGARVRDEIEERAGRPVSIGALYATLHRLEGKGLIRSIEETPEAGRPGRARKYCSLTPDGRAALRHSTEKMALMMEGVDTVLETES